MDRIVLSEDCKIIGYRKLSRRVEVAPARDPRDAISRPVDFAEVELMLVMPRGAPDETRIPLPSDDPTPFEEVHIGARYRLVLERIDN